MNTDLEHEQHKKKRDFSSFFWTVLENFPIVLTVVFGAYAAMLAQFSTISQTDLLFWILTIVTLLAASEILVRIRRLRKIEKLSGQSIEKIDKFSNETNKTLDIVKKRISVGNLLITRTEITEFASRIKPANEICISGLILSSIASPKYIHLLQRKLEDGASVRINLMNPDGPELETMVRNFENPRPAHEIRDQLELNLISFFELSKSVPGSKLEVRSLDTIIPSSLILIDPNDSRGRLHVEIYGYKWPTPDRPHLELYKQVDGRWFTMFCEEFERRWKASTPYLPFTSYCFSVSDMEPVRGRPVVFLDRDGVINEPVGLGDYVSSVEGFKFLGSAIDAIKLLSYANASVRV